MPNSKNTQAIAILPYRKWRSFNLSQMPLDELEWPLGKPERLVNALIKDLTPEDHIITFPRKVTYLLPRPKIRAKISIMIAEPDIIHHRYLKWSYWLNWRFYKILSKNKVLLSSIENGEFFYFSSKIYNKPKGDR